MTSPYERLMAEAIPTRPTPPPSPSPPARPIRPWTPEEQAQHYADLLEGIDGWHYREPEPDTGPNLRLITADHERHSA